MSQSVSQPAKPQSILALPCLDSALNLQILVTLANRIWAIHGHGHDVDVWTIRECTMAIMVSNLPLTVPLWKRFFGLNPAAKLYAAKADEYVLSANQNGRKPSNPHAIIPLSVV